MEKGICCDGITVHIWRLSVLADGAELWGLRQSTLERALRLICANIAHEIPKGFVCRTLVCDVPCKRFSNEEQTMDRSDSDATKFLRI